MTRLESALNHLTNIVVTLLFVQGLLFSTQQFTKLII